jgi:RHS repeat-associated protein
VTFKELSDDALTHSKAENSGEQYDSDLGLYYLRARYYNPNTGRFMSRDPEDGKPIDPKTLHKYLYAGGDPVNRIDPRGREEAVDEGLTTTQVVIRTVIVAGACGAAIRDIYKDIVEALDDPEKEPESSLLLDIGLQLGGVCGGAALGAFAL